MSIVLSLEKMPLCIGASERPNNPSGLPDTFPIQLHVNKEIGRLEQVSTNELQDLLNRVYELGVEMGTPSDNTNLGKPYVDDFVTFITNKCNKVSRVLEIGAGVGYLSKVLKEKGWNVDSIEPGKGYSDSWEKYGVDVINDFFPSPRAKGPYDLIVFYTVLEHIKDTTFFLNKVSDHLSEGGKVILAVPDCSSEIECGDPAMLLHEHFHYFTKSSLGRTLNSAGFDAQVFNSTFGRCLYAVAQISGREKKLEMDLEEINSFEDYGNKASKVINKFSKELASLISAGSVGIYCPSRVLNLLSDDLSVRFFDDSKVIHHKYYPPFTSKVESREELINLPTDSLLIMSRTFGNKLKKELSGMLSNTKIYLFEDILSNIN